MTFEEAYNALANGEPMSAHLMIAREGAMNIFGGISFLGTAFNNVPCIGIISPILDITLFWTADGISTTRPGAGGS